MPTMPGIRDGGRVAVTSAESHRAEAAAAVAELAEALGPDAALYAVFVAPGYDLDVLGRALRETFGDRVIGCTSSGNIGAGGYDQRGVCGVAFAGEGFRARTIAVGPLDDVADAVDDASGRLGDLRDTLGDSDGFALLLTDGLARNEDALAAGLMAALGDVPIIGGSAGDGLRFHRTAVYHDGVFAERLATITVVRPGVPHRLFRLQHHEPTATVLIATEVDPARRMVRSFNGRPAVQAYAEAVGADPAAIKPATFSRHPLLLKAGGSTWIRSFAEVHPDDALSLLARVELGDVLRVGRSVGMVEKLEDRISQVRAELGSLSGMLVFDCVLRRLECEERGLADQVGAILAGNGAAGFSTYGEQFNGMHMNQTLVAVAFA